MTILSVKAKFYNYWLIILIPILSIIFFFIAVKIVNPIEYPNSDFFTFWLAGHLAILGQNPYITNIWIGGHNMFGASWIPNATYVYPLPLSLFFAPFGLLPLYQAFILWNFFTQYMIILSVSLLLMLNPGKLVKKFILPLFAGVIIFRPTLITLVNGQLSGFLLLVIVCMIFLWEHGKWWQGSALLPILALKPNLGVPIIILLSIYLIFQRKTSSIIAEVLSGLALITIGLAQNTNWISEFLKAGNIKLSQTFGFSPTIWGISALICKYRMNCSVAFGTILGLIFMIAYLYFLTRKQSNISPALAVGFAISIMLLLTPYTWPYDQLLLIVPIIIFTMSLAKAGYRFMPLALIFIVIDVIAIILLGISAIIQMEIFNAIIPLSVFSLFIWYFLNSRNGFQRNSIG
jgi:hypothetical protein